MRGALLLARRYIVHHRIRTIILVAAIALTIYLPLVTHFAILRFQQQASVRATATPLVVGAKGSRFGLAIHALHFRGDPPEAITMAAVDRINASQLAQPIPILARFRAGGAMVVGTTAEYFELRGLVVEQGASLSRLGDCVIGVNVAHDLGLGSGDRLLTEPENAFDLTGPSPLNLRVVGVLARTGTADDDVIFTELKTTWIIAGIGHGHGDASLTTNDHQHKASRANLGENAEVTDDNLLTFHFHGKAEDFPLTAIIAIPDSEKSATLLMGRYLSPDETRQIIRPTQVVDELMEIILQTRRLVDAGIALLAIAMLLLIGLVMLLSMRLRKREMETMFRLGCSRSTIVQVKLAEIGMVFLMSVCCAVVLCWVTVTFVVDLATVWYG